MKVFFEGKTLTFQKRGGISRLVFEVIKSLNRKEDLEKILYRGLFVDKYPFQKEWFNKCYGIRKPYFLNSRAFSLIDNLGMEMAYQKNANEDLVFHSFFYRVPKHPKGPVVVHAHDMISEIFGSNKKIKDYKQNSFNKADIIISVSDSTTNDLNRLFSIDPKKIVKIPYAVSDFFAEMSNQKKDLERPVRPYMLYVGMRYFPYKNFDLLLDVFIKEKFYLDFDLVLFGGENELTDIQKEKIANTSEKGSWVKQKFGDDYELFKAYSNASVFVFPSLYEGFGIPPLEAMACSCPVVASNASAIPEVVGDAGLLFDPRSQNDLAKQIKKVIDDKFLVSDITAKGKQRINNFTWDGTADKIYEVYSNLLK